MRMNWRQLKVEDSDLSPRAKTALLNSAFLTAGDVAFVGINRIARIPAVGQLTRREIMGWLVELEFAPDNIPYPPKGRHI
jgi:hypothetical protein